MKRKDWKTKNLKKDIFGKKKRVNKYRYLIRERFFFLRKLFLRKNKYLTKKSFFSNYFFFGKMLKSYKLKKQFYLYNMNFKFTNNFYFFPEFAASKNVFNKKSKALTLLNKYNLNYLYIKNSYNTNNKGLTYYISGPNLDNFNFQKILLEEENFGLLHHKNIVKLLKINFNNEVNIYFNFNIHNLCLLEIYKIIIILYLKN